MRRTSVSAAALAVLAGGLALAVHATARAAPPPAVRVSLSLAQPWYRQQLAAPSLARLEAEGARALAEALGGQIRFVRFTPDGSAEVRLEFVLDSLEPGSRPLFTETGFHIRLSAPDGVTRGTYRTFRPQERFTAPVADVDALVREIREWAERTDPTRLVRELLSLVPITERTRLLPDPFGWVLPHREADVCMDGETLLKVKSSFPSGAALMKLDVKAHPRGEFPAQEEEFRDGVLLRPAEPQPDLDRLKAAPPEQVRVTGVYVVEYRLLVPCGRATSPEAVEFRTGAGR